jgi:hypothetical protein
MSLHLGMRPGAQTGEHRQIRQGGTEAALSPLLGSGYQWQDGDRKMWQTTSLALYLSFSLKQRLWSWGDH